MSLLVYSGTLELYGAVVAVVGTVPLDFLFCNSRSVILISCRIYLPHFLLPDLFIALEQSAIAAITLSACMMVGQMSILWLKCMVSMQRFLKVYFMWHICVR